MSAASKLEPNATTINVYGTNCTAADCSRTFAEVVSFQRMQPNQPPKPNAHLALASLTSACHLAGILQNVQQIQELLQY